MSFLKTLGKIGVGIGKTLPIAGPILAAIIPGEKDDAIITRTVGAIDPIVKIIADVEQMGAALSLDGAQKLTAATALVTVALTPYASKLGIDDPVLFKKGAEEIAQGVVDVLNSLKAPA